MSLENKNFILKKCCICGRRTKRESLEKYVACRPCQSEGFIMFNNSLTIKEV